MRPGRGGDRIRAGRGRREGGAGFSANQTRVAPLSGHLPPPSLPTRPNVTIPKHRHSSSESPNVLDMAHIRAILDIEETSGSLSRAPRGRLTGSPHAATSSRLAHDPPKKESVKGDMPGTF